MKKDVKLSITMPLNVKGTLQRLAKKHGMTANKFAYEIIHKYLYRKA